MILREEKFKNMQTWLTAVQGPQLGNCPHRSSRNTGRAHFYGSESFEESLSLATKGWPRGSNEVNSYLLKLTPFLRTIKRYQKTWSPGILPQGGVIIDRYVKGLPDCLLNRAKKPNNKFARLVFNGSMLNDIRHEEYFKRGTLIIALVHTLERNNFRIQINVQNSTEKNDYKLVTEVVLKDYNQSLDLDRIAFWACHLSVNRRISFSYRETLEQIWIDKLNAGNTYGRTCDHIPDDKNTIYFPAIQTHDRYYDSIESMIAYLKELLAKMGVIVS